MKSIGKTSWQVKQRWKEKNYTRIAIDLPNQLAEELKAKTEAEGRSRTALIKELLEKYLHK